MLESFSEVAEAAADKPKVDIEAADSILEKMNGLDYDFDSEHLFEQIEQMLSYESDDKNSDSVLDRMNEMFGEKAEEVEKPNETDQEHFESVLDRFNSEFFKENASKNIEQQENKTRELTEEEKNHLKENLQWTDKQLSKCTIDENGVIHYKTDCEYMEGKETDNGIRYERKTVDIHGVKVEGVFPVFDSDYDVQLPEDMEKSSNTRQFRECNSQLKEAVQNDPELKLKFNDEQLEDIENGDTPTGYVWHHSEETGKMQLVKVEDHDRTQGGAAHTGGKSLWGGGYGNV